MADTIQNRVTAIIVDKLGVEDSEVTSEASFTNDLGADSLDTVELIMEFEREEVRYISPKMLMEQILQHTFFPPRLLKERHQRQLRWDGIYIHI